jgi:hypothetical protein
MKHSIEILAFLSVLTILTTSSDVIVKTSRGNIAGFHVNYGDDKNATYYGKADIFLGIPYAVAPVGNLRFQVQLFKKMFTLKNSNLHHYFDSPELPHHILLYLHGMLLIKDLLAHNLVFPMIA